MWQERLVNLRQLWFCIFKRISLTKPKVYVSPMIPRSDTGCTCCMNRSDAGRGYAEPSPVGEGSSEWVCEEMPQFQRIGTTVRSQKLLSPIWKQNHPHIKHDLHVERNPFISVQSWIWLGLPLLMFACDTVYSYCRRHFHHIEVVGITRFPGGILELRLVKNHFHIRPGQVRPACSSVLNTKFFFTRQHWYPSFKVTRS